MPKIIKFTISFVQGSKYIECHTCNMRSFHPKDIEYKYCANCNRFHETGLPRNREDCIRLLVGKIGIGIDVFG